MSEAGDETTQREPFALKWGHAALRFFRSWHARIFPQGNLPRRWGRQTAAEHAGESGIVLAIRYPPRGAFGMHPSKHWRRARLLVDEHVVTTATVESAPSRWVPLAPGPHRVEAQSLIDYHIMATIDFEVVDRPVIVNVFPKRARGALSPFPTGGKLEVGT
jgi:hypothetical protein